MTDARTYEEERDDFYVDQVRAEAGALAATLREATEKGVSHAVILPQLIMVFRDAFGEMPAAVAELVAAAAEAP